MAIESSRDCAPVGTTPAGVVEVMTPRSHAPEKPVPMCEEDIEPMLISQMIAWHNGRAIEIIATTIAMVSETLRMSIRAGMDSFLFIEVDCPTATIMPILAECKVVKRTLALRKRDVPRLRHNNLPANHVHATGELIRAGCEPLQLDGPGTGRQILLKAKHL